jgi:hypothetical protein
MSNYNSDGIVGWADDEISGVNPEGGQRVRERAGALASVPHEFISYVTVRYSAISVNDLVGAETWKMWGVDNT